MPEPWERLRGCIATKHVTDTHFVSVSCESAEPARAAKIVNGVARAYVRYHMLRRMEINNDVFLFLQEQKQKEELALQESEQKLQEFREQSHISSLDASDKEHPVLKRLSVLNGELTEKQVQRIEIEAQWRVIQQALDAGDQVLTSSNDKLFSIQAMEKDETVSQVRSGFPSEGPTGQMEEKDPLE